MARVDAQGWLKKWGTNLQASGQYITAGVKAVQQAPGQAAAAAQDRMLANLTQSVTSGAWARAVSSVSLGDWQNAMINKGIPRLSQGITAAQASKVQIITQTLQVVDAAAAAANSLPRGDINASIARAAAFMTYMHSNAPKRKG